jgi:branched-chain amino acid transport system permease protein
VSDASAPRWIDPIACHYPEYGTREVETNPHLAHQVTWDETRQFGPSMHLVGRLRYYYKWPGHGGRLWWRTRYWPTRRRVLNIRGEYNPKTKRREKTIVDKRPIWWALAFAAFLLLPFVVPVASYNTVMSAAAVFAIYASINLCWMLIVGTASIFSLASYAVVGAAAYGTTYMAIQACRGGHCR